MTFGFWIFCRRSDTKSDTTEIIKRVIKAAVPSILPESKDKNIEKLREPSRSREIALVTTESRSMVASRAPRALHTWDA